MSSLSEARVTELMPFLNPDRSDGEAKSEGHRDLENRIVEMHRRFRLLESALIEVAKKACEREGMSDIENLAMDAVREAESISQDKAQE